MLALPLPLNFFELDPDLPEVLLEDEAGGAIDPEPIAVFSLPHVAVLCPEMPQKVQFFFFHMHVAASWFGSRHRVQTFESLFSSLLLGKVS